MNASPTGRTAIVTGASRGIGLAITRALAGSGTRVAMLARGAEALAARATEIGPAAMPIPCDVSDADAVARAAGVISRTFGGAPDILINNAGLFHPMPIEEVTPQEFASTLRVNLLSAFLMVHTLLPGMRTRHSGHIVTIGSVADRIAMAENAAYSASKFGARALHEVLRTELRGTGVRVTLVSPGSTDTSIWDGLDRAGKGRFPPREAMLDADAVAAAVLYAVSQPPAVNVDELRLSRA